jgi:hypothetical protein
MSAWKQFLASDIIVNPFVVNKGFTYSSSLWDTDDVGIDYFYGVNIPFVSGSNKTGFNNTQYQSLIYNSVKQLYYSNFLSSSTGDNVAQPILIPGAGPSGSGDVFIGQAESPLYDNFLQSTLTPNRYFPTASNSDILVISISSKIYGEYIVPTSLNISFVNYGNFTDDGEGNLIYSGDIVGNVIYPQGMVIFTNEVLIGATFNDLIDDIQNDNANCAFSSSMTIYETQYKCTIRESEFNATLNPSAQQSGSVIEISGSYFSQRGDGTLANNVTGSYFSPYVTTVGLYDELQNLLAIGKLAQPLPTSDTTDTTILINLDL